MTKNKRPIKRAAIPAKDTAALPTSTANTNQGLPIMTFTSSAKTITHYADSPGIRRLEQACGGRLTELTQREKYQLSEAISSYLSSMVADEENMELGPDDVWTIMDYSKQCCSDIDNNVFAVLFILQHETPETLSHLLPAVAEYARDDK